MSLDKLAEKIAALGIPGLVLLIVLTTSGFYGAAALTSSLALLGGPLGMLGGIAVLGLLVLISNGVATYGSEAVVKKVVENLKKEGLAKDEVLKKVDSYPISKTLNLTIKEYIETSWDTM